MPENTGGDRSASGAPGAPDTPFLARAKPALDRAPQAPRRSSGPGKAGAFVVPSARSATASPGRSSILRRATRVTVVIPAGGMGTRLGHRVPKQFLKIDGVPILAVTVRQFAVHPDVDSVIVAVPSAFVRRAERILAEPMRRVKLIVVTGGEDRQESVRRALQAAPPDVDIILVHDAVRPFVTRALIDAVVRAAIETGAAVCGMPIADTVKRVREDLVETTVDRSTLWAVQTPQAFRASLLREAHEKARRDGVTGTDDAMLVERLGQPVRVVRGSEDNVKITTPYDLRRARAVRL